MTVLLSAETRDRLAKLCGMFGSDFDGERAAAAALADRLVREHGLTWNEIVGGAAPPVEKSEPVDDAVDNVAFDLIRVRRCRESAAPYSRLQREFIEGFIRQLGKGRLLSGKQRPVLDQLHRMAELYGPRQR